jgi:glutaconate CoA-transferase subunit A
MNKLVSLDHAAAMVRDGQIITIGGTLCQRVPAVMVRELARQRVRNLTLVKASPGYDIDVLATAGCVSTVRSGIVTLEQPFGMSPGFRHAVESGKVTMVENACPAVMASLQAAAYGLPFLPVAGFQGSDLRNLPQFGHVTDPFTGADVLVSPAIRPDWAILFVHEADERGNARIYGSPAWDRLMSRAARRTIIVAEKIQPTAHFVAQPELTLVPELFVECVVHAPGGAWPTSGHPAYDLDEAAMRHYLDRARTPEGFQAYLDETAERDHSTQGVTA